MASPILEFILRAKDEATANIDKVKGKLSLFGAEIGQTGRQLGFTDRSMGRLAGRFIGFAAVAGAVAQAVRTVNKELVDSVKAYEDFGRATSDVDVQRVDELKEKIELARIELGEKLYPVVVRLSEIKLKFVEQLNSLIAGRREAKISASENVIATLQAEAEEIKTQIALAERTGQTQIAVMSGGETRIVNLRAAYEELKIINEDIKKAQEETDKLRKEFKTQSQLEAEAKAIEAARKAAEQRRKEEEREYKARIDAMAKAGEAENQYRQKQAAFADDIQKMQIENGIASMQDETQRRIAEIRYRAQIERDEFLYNASLYNISTEEQYAVLAGITEREEREITDIRRRAEEERTRAAEKAQKERERIAEAEMLAQKQVTYATISAATAVVAAFAQQKERLKPLYVAMAIMRAASSTIQAVDAAWQTANGNYYLGAALSAAAVVENTALLAGQIASIYSAATGANFITRGPQLMLVGDNPSGREHVQVTPLGGGTTNNNNATINLTINGDVSRETIDYAYDKLSNFARMYKRAQYEGMLA